jgi:hypothetical protein
MFRPFLFLALAFLLTVCSKKQEINSEPPAENTEFDVAHSDPAAVELADSVLAAAGGKEAWDKIRFIKWADGQKIFYWDKLAQNIRIETPSKKTISIINLSTTEGRIKSNEKELGEGDSLKNKIAEEHAAWLTSSNKIFLPFNLKQQGFSLQYLGEEELRQGKCNVVKMAHPEREIAFKIFVDLDNNLIQRSQVLTNDSDSVIATYNFGNYQKYKAVRLALPEGDEIKDLAIDEDLPEVLFTEL